MEMLSTYIVMVGNNHNRLSCTNIGSKFDRLDYVYDQVFLLDLAPLVVGWIMDK